MNNNNNNNNQCYHTNFANQIDLLRKKLGLSSFIFLMNKTFSVMYALFEPGLELLLSRAKPEILDNKSARLI